MAALKHNGTEVARITLVLNDERFAHLERRYSVRSNRRVLEQTVRVWPDDVGGGRNVTGWTRWGRFKEGVDLAKAAEDLRLGFSTTSTARDVTLEVR